MSVDEKAFTKALEVWESKAMEGIQHGHILNAEEEGRIIIEAYEAAKEPPKRIVRKDGEIVGIEPNPNHQPVGSPIEETARTIFSVLTHTHRDYWLQIAESVREDYRKTALAVLSKRESGWRPIETAPKDGTFVLTALESGYLLVLQYCANNYWRRHVMDDKGLWNPTHWMPLPNPPTNEIEDQEGK